MLPYYTFINNFIMGILVCSFHQRISKRKLSMKIDLFIAPLIITVYMLLSYSYIPEPLRILIGLVILATILWVVLKPSDLKTFAAAFTLALIFYLVTWFASILITAIFTANFNNPTYDYIAGIIVNIVMCLIFLRIPKLKNGVNCESFEVKGIVYTISGILLTIYSGMRITIYFAQEYSEYRIFMVFFILPIIVLLLVIGTFLLTYFNRKHKEKQTYLDSITKLELECEQNMELYRSERSANHRYKDVVPMTSSTYAMILSDLKALKADGKILPLSDMIRRMENAKIMTDTMADDFVSDTQRNMIAALELPETLSSVQALLEYIAKQCYDEDIGFFCKNTIEKGKWDILEAHQSGFVLLLAKNLLRNAVKEIAKTDFDGKLIEANFLDHNGCLAFEVNDNAPEFPVEILSKLGERGNSTNGTGDGYAEIFEFLDKTKASLLIHEESPYPDYYDKTIRVVFDGKRQIIVRTGYRFEELKAALKHTNIMVEKREDPFISQQLA